MSKLLNHANNANLVVAEATVDTLNPIIFKAKVIGNLNGITVSDGKHYRINTKTNSAEEITAESLTKSAKKALSKGVDKDGSLSLAEDFGLISAVSFKVNTDKDSSASGSTDILRLASALNMKIAEIEVATQHEIIFKTIGIQRISGLTKDGAQYYNIDTKRNTATLINPEGIAAQAKADFLKGKDSDFTALANSFNLITSVSLVRKEA